LLEEQTIAEI